MCTHWWLTFTWISCCCCWPILLLKIFPPSVHFLISTFFFFMELVYVPVSNYFFALTNFMMCQTTICDNSFHRPTLLRPYLWRRLIKRTNGAGFKKIWLWYFLHWNSERPSIHNLHNYDLFVGTEYFLCIMQTINWGDEVMNRVSPNIQCAMVPLCTPKCLVMELF